jgi:hypothetical protein
MVADIEDEPHEVEPLPNIDFNIRQGNSLIGFTGIQEVATDQGDASLTNYGGGVGENVRKMYNDVIKAVERHRQAISAKEAADARRLAEKEIEKHARALNEKIHKKFHDSGIEDVTLDEIRDYSPFHWVLEFATVYRDGGFDVVIGNPPWEVLKPNREEFFCRYDETFRNRLPEQKEKIQSELLNDAGIKTHWERYKKRMHRRADYFNNSGEYTLQKPKIHNQSLSSELDLSALFLERVQSLVTDQGYVSLILPGFIINGAIAKDIRQNLLENTDIKSVIGFENKGIFDQIDDRYKFGIFVFEQGGSTDQLIGIFQQTDLEILRNIDSDALEIPRRVLQEYSPGAAIFPELTSQSEADALNEILKHPHLSENIDDAWNISIVTKELHEPTDSHRFVDSENKGDYPVYDGGNVYQFQYNTELDSTINSPRFWSRDTDDVETSAKQRVIQKSFRKGRLKKTIYTKFGGESTSKSQKGFVNDLLTEYRDKPLDEEDILADFTEYRISYRKISNATNERTVIASVLPKNVVCLETLQTIKPYSINVEEGDLPKYPMHSAYQRTFSDDELFAAVGLLNSIAFDFLLRTKVTTDVLKYKMLESQIPRLTEGDDWFYYISQRAARLNCYGDEFAEMRERLGDIEPVTAKQKRRDLQVEIDAAAFHAYGLGRRDVQFILNDFHRVKNPRMMDQEYFDMVFEKFDVLEKNGPFN